MDVQLAQFRDREEPVAALRATEGGIYGRFGYGVATEQRDWTIPRSQVELLPSLDEVSTRFVDPDAASGLLRGVYEEARTQRSGLLAREGPLWEAEAIWHDRADASTEPRFVVAEEHGAVTGYLRWRVREGRSDGLPDNRLRVEELIAVSAAAERTLWGFALGTDLVSEVTAAARPVDDVLPWILKDPRRAAHRRRDALWLRILDVPAALTARRYGTESHIVLDVVDPGGGPATGRWLLQTGSDGSDVTPTSADPDVTLLAGDLATLFLGGSSASTLARAGRVHGSPTALVRADRLFATIPAPWSA
jgi:predicted acetyltransferase